ncbi:transcription initiation factor TFIID subunit 9 [Venturia canescens]|uniref:transcription initiation factor TFIID subunit 9 n=1 Tax=Venturia canescens TaxID=32260 RepID=UPI001C9C72FE|nr:transcription initiation factor TFIID subunit 9 [Venturia canescens]XP_043284729.1 transcription initiation factor TFIID subunit 9 [Venturia canescens]XP_043284730.1 transcription initiation factor TFIID subunit 9 [Venturia canescens]
MAEKAKTMSSLKHIPKDAQVIMSIMKDMGIADYEPKVINQLLEFTYRYITCILDDSKIYANHAKKKFIDLDDVRLAVKMQLDRTFTNPPPRDVLLDVARAKNNIPLPFVKPNNGLRLPPDRYCLNATNYRLKNIVKKPAGKSIHTMGNSTMGGGSVTARVKSEGNKTNLSIVKRPATLATVARTQTISIPKPVFKFSTGSTTSGAGKTPATKPKIQISTSQPAPAIKMETDETNKRKREDDDYDVP